MKRRNQIRKHFLKNQKGAVAIEYGLIAALIVVAVIASITLLGDENSSLFNNNADKVSEVVNDAISND